MKPKEKAEELFDKYYNYTADMGDPNECAKQCALIAVDEILDVNLWYKDFETEMYWEEVKQEIEEL